MLTSVEVCAGGGGSALGLEAAGFAHVALVEKEYWACEALRVNRPEWNVYEEDLRGWEGLQYRGVDLLSGGVPCTPFTSVGQKLGERDGRDLFPHFIRLVRTLQPRAFLIENVPNLLAQFPGYFHRVVEELGDCGYGVSWDVLNSADYGVCQARRRLFVVGLRGAVFDWGTVTPSVSKHVSLGEGVGDLMGAQGWERLDEWMQIASTPCPTLIGGSGRYGGPKLTGSGGLRGWRRLGIDARGLAKSPPAGADPMPVRLTLQMAARCQGFPDEHMFPGSMSQGYRSVGNACPGPLVRAIGMRLSTYLKFG